MKFRSWLTAFLVVACLLGASLSASAITLTFTGGTHQRTAGNYLVGPYSMMLDSDGTGPQPAQFYAGICDDSAATITAGQSWQATRHEVTADGIVGAKYYNAGAPEASLRNYLAVTYLAEQLLALPTPTASWTGIISDTYNATRTAYQWAIWTIFNTAPSSPVNVSSLIASAYAAVDNHGWVGGGWAVYTPLNLGTNGPQEMLIRTPEASSLATLALSVGAFGLLGFFYRRRLS